MKSLVLGYRTALAYWNAARARNCDTPLSPADEARAMATAIVPHQDEAVEVINSPLLISAKPPIDVISPKAGASRKASFMRVHVQTTPLPPGSLAYLGKVFCDEEALEVYAATPELCLVQMGCLMQRSELAELAFELCGGYALRPDGAGSTQIKERPQVTTTSRMQDYVARACGVRGVRQARFAAAWSFDGSRSPRESQIALEMTLPHTLGGYGLPRPKLNESIALEGAARRAAGAREIYPDFYWPEAHVVLEYDSDAFHSDEAKREHDIRKRNAYEMLGIHALSMTNRQFNDQLQLTCIMEELSKLLGCETHRLTATQQAKRAKLHGFLTCGHRLSRK